MVEGGAIWGSDGPLDSVSADADAPAMASVSKTSVGTWQCRYRTPEGSSRKQTFKTRGEAQRFAREVEGAKDRGQYVDPRDGRITLGDYAETWMGTRLHRPRTAARTRSDLRTHILPRLGHRPMGAIRHSEVQGLVRAMSETSAPASVKNVSITLASIFTAAVADGVIGSSPCTGVTIPRVPKRRMVLPSPEEVHAVADAMPERYRVAVLLGAGAGLRIGETLGLRLEDVDFLRRELTVTHQLSPEGALVAPKSLESTRTVPLGDVVLEALSAHCGAFPGPMLITTTKGNPVRRSRWGEMWRPTLQRAGLSFRYHDLRHFYASALIDGGYSAVAVAKVMGHASALITLDVYGHLWPDANDVPRTALDAVLERSCPSRVPGEPLMGKSAGQDG